MSLSRVGSAAAALVASNRDALIAFFARAAKGWRVRSAPKCICFCVSFALVSMDAAISSSDRVKLGTSQGQNLAVTVLYVPCSRRI